jgi:hypothetical protein
VVRKTACFSWKSTMLEFAEAVLREIKNLRESSEDIILNGTIADMERYRFMMGRLEGLKLVDQSVRALLKSRTDDDGFSI